MTLHFHLISTLHETLTLSYTEPKNPPVMFPIVRFPSPQHRTWNKACA